MQAQLHKHKPRLSFWQIWNMCFGFLGIQFGFALQNANVSRIFQTLGAEQDAIPGLWIAAPLTGLLVQPIIGYMSDRTWNSLGRRRPYFLIGAILTSLALLAMPNSPELWIAAGTLWILDASINISMEPFRAFVGDQLPKEQHSTGYAMQSFFIGIGAVVASMLPWILEKAGVANVAAAGHIPDTVRFSFYIGAAVLLAAVGWTVFRTKEYPPEQFAAFAGHGGGAQQPILQPSVGECVFWALSGAIIAGVVTHYGLKKEVYILAVGLMIYGAALTILRRSRSRNAFVQIMSDLHGMPRTMRLLAVVQLFSWFALFSMWIYTNSVVTQIHFNATDTTSKAYNEGANWVGVLFAAYNGFAALAAILIPMLANRFGLRVTHLISLWIGGAALIAIPFMPSSNSLLIPMIGIGIAWAAILSIPYALLADSLPLEKMGVYMGIFNFFIVVPQLLAASILGAVLEGFFDKQPMYALIIGGICFFLAGLFVLRVNEPQVHSKIM